MLAALVLVAARDATRAELAECRGLISDVITDAPPRVRAVAAAIVAVVRDLGGTSADAALCPPPTRVATAPHGAPPRLGAPASGPLALRAPAREALLPRPPPTV